MAPAEPEPRWEECGCPVCGAGREDRREVQRFPESAYYACARCGLVYLSPRLDEPSMNRLYQSGTYYQGEKSLGYETYEEDAAVYRRTFERRLEELRPWKPHGRLLDVGCGTGLFLEVAAERGYDVHGLDVSEYARASAARDGKALLADCISVGTLETADFAPASFDVVTMFDFFEHVYHPTEFVEHLARVLAPGGVAVIATPDYDSWLRRVLRGRTVSFKIPEHVTYYTASTLSAAVGRRFKVGHIQAIGQYCTTDFVERRLAAVTPGLGTLFAFGVRLAGAHAWQPYVPSGSLLAILLRR